MAQDVAGSRFKGKEIQTSQQNGEGKKESNGSTDSWLINVKRTFDPPYKIWQVSAKVCIYRIPQGMIHSNPEACVPSVISFGPYHYRKTPQLIKMDQYKVEAIHRMKARLKTDEKNLIEEVRKLESEIRECYAEPIEWDGESLSWMLTMDACFILEFFNSFMKRRFDNNINSFSLVFQNSDTVNCTFRDILQDILKLENQIPLCTLITLLQLECETRDKTITELAKRLSSHKFFQGDPFAYLSEDESKSKLKEHLQENPPPCHLLDLSRMIMKDVLAGSSPNPVKNVEYQDTPLLHQDTPPSSKHSLCISCSQLQVAGIKFKSGNIGFENRWFRSSTLSLPRIRMSGRTMVRLRNLVAYEECQRFSWSPKETLVSHHVKTFKHLIDSGKDVSILKISDIIFDASGTDQDIARMFKSIMTGTTLGRSEEVQEVLKRLREHCKSQWTAWMSQFKEEYFSKPWYTIYLFVATILLGMTAVQTVYSVKK